MKRNATMEAGMKSQEEAIQEITRRLVEYYQPLKVYLFGSTARGERGPDSDLDLCVVVPDETSAAKLSVRSAWEAVRGVGYANDGSGPGGQSGMIRHDPQNGSEMPVFAVKYMKCMSQNPPVRC